MALITDNQSSKVADPRKCSFHFPPAFVSSKWSSILRFLLAPIGSMRRNQFYSSVFQALSQLIRISCFIVNKPFYSSLRFARTVSGNCCFVQGGFDQRDFRRGRRVQVVPQRNSFAVCHHHPLRTLSAFGFSNAEPPFLAGAKLPSANVSAQFSWPRSSSSAMNARQASSQASRSSHSWSRRQQVDGDGYCAGRSFHRAPLLRTQRMPSKQRRSEILLRPFRCLSSGSTRNGASLSHNLSVNSLLKRFAARESSFQLFRRLPMAFKLHPLQGLCLVHNYEPKIYV
jgi:hypothetical protein